MFILQDDKIYILEDGKYVRVEIYSDKILKTDEVLENPVFDIIYTLYELQCKYHGFEPYVEDVKKVEPKATPKKVAKKPVAHA